MANVSRYVLGLLFFGILACLFIPASAETILFMGDSITQTPSSFVPEYEYPTLINQRLTNNFLYTDYNVISVGVNGQCSSEGKNNIISNIETYNPSVICFMYGTVDLYYGISDTEIINNINFMVNETKKRNIIPYVLLVIPAIRPNENFNESIKNLNNKIITESEKNNFSIIDTYDCVDSNPNNAMWDEFNYSNYVSDNIHPNINGMELLSNKIYNQFIIDNLGGNVDNIKNTIYYYSLDNNYIIKSNKSISFIKIDTKYEMSWYNYANIKIIPRVYPNENNIVYPKNNILNVKHNNDFFSYKNNVFEYNGYNGTIEWNYSNGWADWTFTNMTLDDNRPMLGVEDDYFEDGSVSDWDNEVGANIAINSTVVKDGIYSAQFNGTTNLKESRKNFSSTLVNNFTIIYDILINGFTDADDARYLQLEKTGGTYANSIQIYYVNGNLITSDGSPVTIQALNTDTWYNIRMDIYPNSTGTDSTFDIYVDNVSKLTNRGTRGTVIEFDKFVETHLSVESDDLLLIDNIRIYNESTISGLMELNIIQDAGVNRVHKYCEILGTDPSVNTSSSLWVNGSDDNVTFNGWEEVNSSFNVSDNITIDLVYEYRYAKFKVYSNTTYQPETNIISNITITSGASSLLPPQNLTNITSQTEICFNWDDYANADYWNISQRIPSIPYTDVIIVLDGVKDAEFTDRAHTWVLDSPNPTGSNGDKELISWIRNTTTLSGYADGEDDDALNNDDSFTIMLDMTANNLSTDDRQFILSESGTVTAKRWGGAAWLPQSTNAIGVVVGAGIAGSIQYEMQIPISELTSFTNGSTIKMAMAREDTSQNPDVTKYYPKGLINDTDATVWTSINLTAESEYTFIGNTTLSNYTVTGLTPFTWYRHRFSTINGSTESSYVYSNDITKDSPQYTVSGYILTEADLPISGATVWSVCDCGCVCEVNTSNGTGYYQGTCFYNGTYTIYAIATDYDTNSTSVVVNGANQSNVNITLSLTPVADNTIPLSIFIMWSVIMFVGTIIGFMTTGLYGISSSLLTVMIAYMNSKNIINGNVVQYFSGISTSDTIVVGYRSIESMAMSYIYLFIAIVMGIIFILHTVNEVKYNLEPDLEGEFFDE